MRSKIYGIDYARQNHDSHLICNVNSEDYAQQNHDQAALGIFKFAL